jgi:purine catabolism regulator
LYGPSYLWPEPASAAHRLYEPYNPDVTVRIEDILRSSGLALKPVAGQRAASRTVRWVHVSELEDPTPWLRGGELLLTTGMGLGKTPARQRAYVERLSAAGLAGLGFGVGFSYSKVPKALADTADRLGFPVFEVPYPVPFIAITEAVFTRLAGEQIDVLQRSMEAQHSLTEAVLEGSGVNGVVSELARAIHGWAVVLDLHGLPLSAMPRDAGGRAPRLWEELRGARPQEPGFSFSMLDRGDHVSVQPVGARGRVEAFMAIGKRQSLSQFDRIVAGHALSLLAIELDKERAVAQAERRLRGDFLDSLVRGTLSPREAARGLRRFGLEEEGEVEVVALESDLPVDDLTWAVEDVLSRRDGGFLTAPRDDVLYLVLRPDGGEAVEALRRDVEERLGTGVTAGVGSPVAAAETGRSLREARYALQVCRVEGRPVADFQTLGTYRLLLTLQEPDALRAFADSVLAPLDEYDREHGGELIASLRAFLDHNARWEAAAAQLFVHRHTLRYRMRKVEELTGRELATSHDRMEFWLAIRARDLLERPTES